MRSLLLAICYLSLLGSSRETHAVDATAPAVEFTESQTLSPILGSDKKTSLVFAVRNPGETPAEFDVVAKLKDRNDGDVIVTTQLNGRGPLKSFEHRFIRLTMDVRGGSAPYSGFLILQSKGSTNTVTAVRSRPIVIREPLQSRGSLFTVLAGSVCALISVTVAAGFLHSKAKWTDEMGQPSWDFSRSWATSLTAVGGVVGGTLTVFALTDQTSFAPKNAYTILNVLFVFFVAIAPFLYNTIRRGFVPVGATDPSYRGYVGMFYLASFVTLWGVFGQMGTMMLIFLELEMASLIVTWEWIVVEVLLGLVVLGLLGYGATTIYWTVKAQRTGRTEAGLSDRLAADNTPSSTWTPL